ncbi:tyrosine-type recombinase/integrase [Streptomyces sp. NPDC007917]|uniref:tyrosine-type recombinase/integrase n=1 Tax=Streptomyces sp. NPDC007917 TaxID=3364793 RepID=UPI0036F182AF
MNEAFVAARRDADLDLRCLRHRWITHATEFGYPARFVQENVGHSHASTTAIYMSPRELHQPGEKLQVAWSRRESEGVRGAYELAF